MDFNSTMAPTTYNGNFVCSQVHFMSQWMVHLWLPACSVFSIGPTYPKACCKLCLQTPCCNPQPSIREVHRHDISFWLIFSILSFYVITIFKFLVIWGHVKHREIDHLALHLDFASGLQEMCYCDLCQTKHWYIFQYLSPHFTPWEASDEQLWHLQVSTHRMGCARQGLGHWYGCEVRCYSCQ